MSDGCEVDPPLSHRQESRYIYNWQTVLMPISLNSLLFSLNFILRVFITISYIITRSLGII